MINAYLALRFGATAVETTPFDLFLLLPVLPVQGHQHPCSAVQQMRRETRCAAA
jgi:hypothetical protein